MNARQAAVSLAALATLALPAAGEAHGRGRVVIAGPRVYFGFGYGWFPYYGYALRGYGYYPLPPRGGLDLGYARVKGWGALDLHVKPGKAEVWVDGRFAGRASELDGRPSYLWLRKGTHEIAVYRKGYETFRETYEITPGAVFPLHLKMTKGKATLPQAPPPAPPGA
jgi:PEGA domain